MPADPRSSDAIVRAIIDDVQSSGDQTVGVVRSMLIAIGFDFQAPAVKARANDQLIRARASALIEEATRQLQSLEARFREEHVPPATREQPFPPAEAMRALKALDTLRRRVGECGSMMLTQEMPGTDGVWKRLRNERALLLELLGSDIDLLGSAQDLAEATRGLTLADILQRQFTAVEAPLSAVEKAFHERRALLG